MSQVIQLPQKAVILLTSHRSGSTWLSDAIRCHPAIDYCPEAVLYEKLGIAGRRYPGDLLNQADSQYEIEVQPGKWSKIPKFDLSKDLSPLSRSLHFAPYAIEKCHPSFFDFDVDIFLARIEQLEQLGIQVQLVYLVRDPKSLMSSFMNYQKRNPAWYSTIIEAELPRLIQKTYAAISQANIRKPGVGLDYAELKADLAYALIGIYLALWSELSRNHEEAILQVSQLAEQHTNRQNRVKATGSPFLGKTEGAIQGGDVEHENFFNKYQDLVKECYEIYHKTIVSIN